jgi:hypothetical protein
MNQQYPTLRDVQEILRSAALAVTAPIQNISRDTAPEYFRHLQDIPLDLLRVSVDHCIQNDGAFFPSVSSIRKASRTLMCLALQIPSAAEAWAMVQESRKHMPAEYCEVGADMRDGLGNFSGGEYLLKVKEWGLHHESCGICHDAYDYDVFDHPAVSMTVRQLGGRPVLFTGNPSADRARFIMAYQEIVDREVRLSTYSESIKAWIGESREKMLVDSGIRDLAKRLGEPARKTGKGLPEGGIPVYVQGETIDGMEEEIAAAFDRGIGE